jgi:transposase
MEAHDFVDSHRRVTKRLARYISDLCRLLSVSAAARHLGLDWKLVKACDKSVLEAEVGGTQTSGLRLLAVDEIALRKHQHYMTVVLDYESGRVVWMGEGRRFETLGAFFQLMTPAERRGIEAVAMDMWKPYAKAVRVYLPNARIIYDLFHVIANYNQHVLDAVRIAAYRKVRDPEERKVIKGTRFILYKNDRNLTESERPRLQSLLEMNAEIATAYVLRDALKEIWALRSPWDARRALERWCALAVESRIPALIRFAAQLQRHKRGIIAHARFPINTGRLEGTNNRIKVIKRVAYGFHDPDYFALKVKQAFPGHAVCT